MKKKTDVFKNTEHLDCTWMVEKQLSVKAFMQKYIKNIESIYCTVKEATAISGNDIRRIIYVHCIITTKDGQPFMHPIHLSPKNFEGVEEFMNKKVSTDKVSILVLKPMDEKDTNRIYRAFIEK